MNEPAQNRQGDRPPEWDDEGHPERVIGLSLLAAFQFAFGLFIGWLVWA